MLFCFFVLRLGAFQDRGDVRGIPLFRPMDRGLEAPNDSISGEIAGETSFLEFGLEHLELARVGHRLSIRCQGHLAELPDSVGAQGRED